MGLLLSGRASRTRRDELSRWIAAKGRAAPQARCFSRNSTTDSCPQRVHALSAGIQRSVQFINSLFVHPILLLAIMVTLATLKVAHDSAQVRSMAAFVISLYSSYESQDCPKSGNVSASIDTELPGPILLTRFYRMQRYQSRSQLSQQQVTMSATEIPQLSLDSP
jgi:hypothetical protein